MRKGKVIGLAALGVVLIAVCVLGPVRAGTRVSVRTYRMEVAFNGKVPWGDVGPEVEGEGSPTVLTGASETPTATPLLSRSS